ncbi:MAG: type I 3-dehydroquinate dehydratase [Chloroflexi bacterium]|nr:type I 3-dehydroquinate dehydratase [Chloroflexota bacterium]
MGRITSEQMSQADDPEQRRTRRATRMLAVALAAPTTGAALAELHEAARVADSVELRLDLMDEFDLPRLLAERPCPVVVTCRAVREGGRWRGSEEERLAVLRQAFALGADYVDVEADAIDALRAGGLSGPGRLIASSHDFTAMPDDFEARWQALAATGADVVKLVGMARDVRDVVPVARALAQADRPTIAIAMGEAGLASRILALTYPSCLLTFCALQTGGGTAPGQIGAVELLETYRAHELGPDTAIFGHLAPAVDRERLARWNRALSAHQVDGVVVPLVVPVDASPLDALPALAALGVRAAFVAPPFRDVVGQGLDGLTAGACRHGVVNAIVARVGRLMGTWIVEAAGESVEGAWVEGAHRGTEEAQCQAGEPGDDEVAKLLAEIGAE